MPTFETTVNQFNKEAKVFFDALPKTNDFDQIEAGLDALGLLYFGIKDPTDRELYECSMVLQIARKKATERQLLI